MADSVELKRRREDEFPGDEVELEASPAPKRLREDFLLEILDDDDDEVDADAGDQEDIASVMKSLEEEIALPSGSVSPPAPLVAATAEQPDLGYLFEASDDELGLPPTVPSSSDEGGENAEAGSAGIPEGDVDQGVGFGQIWGFDDEINGYDAFDLGIRPEDRTEVVAGDDGDDVAVAFDGGLFDFGDVFCGSSDFAEFSWRSETLPAV